MEMISAKALTYRNKNTEALLAIHPDEYPVSLQIFGSEPEVMSEAVKMINDHPFQILDINMGCPVTKIVKNHEGSALMLEPKKVYDIVSAVVKATDKPVTVKIRKGFDKDHTNAPEIAKIIEEAGAAAVAVHGRLREEYYSGVADWDIIKKVKEAVNIPVIGNGDVNSPQKAEAMLKETGCDGVMIARAAEGNPWIFAELNAYFNDEIVLKRPERKELIDTMLRHSRLLIEYKGEYLGIREMRKHVAWYTKGLPGSARLRGEISEMDSYDKLEELLNKQLTL